MTEKYIITVFGATGSQGSGVIDSVLQHPVLSKSFRLRGITRSIGSTQSERLITKGVEMVVANMDDKASLEEAVKESHAVFAMTNFWEYLDGERETQQGKNIADACLAAGVKQLIWSSAVDVLGLSHGQITGAAHLESKYNVQKYIENIKGATMSAIHIIPGVFMVNLQQSLLQTIGDNSGRLRAPWGSGDDLQIPFIDSEADVGTYVAAVLLAGLQSTDRLNGAEVQAVSEWLTPNQAVAVLSVAKGSMIIYEECSLEDFLQYLPESIKVEIGATTRLITDLSFFGHGSAAKQMQVDRVLEGTGLKKRSLKDWVERNAPLKLAKVDK